MKKTIKIRWALLSLMALGMFASAHTAHADGVVVANVETVRTLDGVINPGWTPPIFWFALTGVSSAGACPTYGTRVLFVANTKEMFAVAMIALLTGRKLQVHYTDTALQFGYCRVNAITAGEPT